MKIKKMEKLVQNLRDKKIYVVRIKNLDQVWLKPYNMQDNRLRKDAKNEFEKDSFKFINNSVFGKP